MNNIDNSKNNDNNNKNKAIIIIVTIKKNSDDGNNNNNSNNHDGNISQNNWNRNCINKAINLLSCKLVINKILHALLGHLEKTF